MRCLWVGLAVFGAMSCSFPQGSRSEARTDDSATIAFTTAPPSDISAQVPRLEHPGTDDGVRALLEEFLQHPVDRVAMSRSLQPSADDYAAIFSADDLTKIVAKYAEQWTENRYVVDPRDGETEILLWKATTEQLREGSGDAREFPEGYRTVAHRLKPGLVFYRCKFVRPKSKHGMTYDGLVFVNDHWVMVSKPYRVLG